MSEPATKPLNSYLSQKLERIESWTRIATLSIEHGELYSAGKAAERIAQHIYEIRDYGAKMGGPEWAELQALADRCEAGLRDLDEKAAARWKAAGP